MPGSFSRARPGDPMQIPAATYNALLDAEQWVRRTRTAQNAPRDPETPDPDTLFVRNDTGGDLPSGAIVKIDDLLTTHEVDESEFLFGERVVSGTTPSASDAGRYAVLIEPTPDEAVGEARASGIVVARVEVEDESHQFAEVQASSTLLKSGARGSASILWLEDPADRDVTGQAWAVLRLGPDPVGLPDWMVVQSSTALAGASYRWTYTLVEAEWNDTTKVLAAKSGGATVTAYNVREMGNTSSVVDGLTRVTSLRTLNPTAVPNGRVVEMLRHVDGGTPVPLFSSPYPLGETCT